MRILFVCSRNRLRSPTAEAIFATSHGVETASAGTAPDSETPLSSDLIDWADVIVAMETIHRQRLQAAYAKHLNGKRIVVLRIPDRYQFMAPDLVAVLQRRRKPLFR